ncbi:MAG: YggT family protein [Chloroflexi bacterium]|nr:MAG: YggT family protein [Chloroflexota bacterium]
MTTTATPPKDTAASVASQTPTNVNVSTAPARDASIWTATRVIALVFTVLEVLLLVRFTIKLLGANADQPLVSAIYGITEPLVAPFRGMFAQPAGTPVVEIATLLSIVFFVLVGALIVAIVRAVTGRRGESNP